MYFGPTVTYGTHGTVTGDHAIYFSINNNAGRGFIFKNSEVGCIASIDLLRIKNIKE